MRLRALLAAFLFMAAPAYAEDGEDAATCATPLALTPALIEAAQTYEFAFIRAPGDNAPPLLLGELSPMAEIEGLDEQLRGTAIFVRDDADAWRAYLPSAWETLIAAFTAHSGEVVLFTQIQIEGPGQSWTMVRSADNFTTASCVTIEFPSDLNQPTWNNETAHLMDFDIRTDGRGEIIAAAPMERDGRDITRFYRYTTRDHGRTWSRPRRISADRLARAGLYTRQETLPASVGVVAELHSAAAPQ